MKTVVIIGAGPAGLTAAYKLLHEKEKFKIVVIERDAQPGGISKTVDYNGNRIDLGGHRFFSKDESINKMWKDILPMQSCPISAKIEFPQKKYYSGSLDPNTYDYVMLERRRISRIFYNNKFFDYPVSINMNTLNKLGFLKSLNCGIGYAFSCIFKKKEDSLENFYINRFGKPLYELFFKEYTTKLWGVTPANLDASWGAQRVKKLSLSRILIEYISKKLNKNFTTSNTSLIEEFLYPKYGPGQLWERLAKLIEDNGVEIRYNTRCSKIYCKNDNVTSITIKKDNLEEEIKCDYLISSMPIKELFNSFQHEVPSEIYNTANTLPYRDFITIGILVDKLLIKNTTTHITINDIPPDCWIYVQDKNVKMGRIQVFNNWSPFMVKDPIETVWIGLEYFCAENDAFWNLSNSEIVSFAIKELAQMGVIDASSVKDSAVIKQKKAYPAYYGSYKNFNIVKNYLNTFHNLICIGRNGQHRYNNMDHSMMTGIRAADYILGKTDIETVWNVNTEQEYCEGG